MRQLPSPGQSLLATHAGGAPVVSPVLVAGSPVLELEVEGSDALELLDVLDVVSLWPVLKGSLTWTQLPPSQNASWQQPAPSTQP